MVERKKIGVIGIQGAISEHLEAMQNALKETNTPGNVFEVKTKDTLKNVDALILPGGESSTISKVLFNSRLHNVIKSKIMENDIPIMGTCAGCVLLSSELSDNLEEIKLLQAMNMQVKRNAFGRQQESFEQDLDVSVFKKPYHGVFIRAPIIKKVWGKCKILSKIDEKIVMARQDNLLALSFHPELTDDFRIHKYFLSMI
jgi:5'-phosphate synthase pdxT subunit